MSNSYWAVEQLSYRMSWISTLFLFAAAPLFGAIKKL